VTTLTIKQLKDAGACHVAIELLRQKFGPKREVTLDAVLSVADSADWHWAARNLLTPSGHAAFQSTTNTTDWITPRAVYIRALATAWFNAWEQDHEEESK
jgi:hypothetical protein